MNGVGRMIGVALVSGVAMASASAQTASSDMSQTSGIIPSGFGDAVDKDVASVRAATTQFKSTDAAESAGYKRVTDCVEYQPAGAMGYHFQNNDLLDTTLDVNHPEVLVYERMADGTFTLNGVEFLVPISAWKSADAPTVMGQPLKRADKLGIYYLHVWSWKASPSGIFSDWNPLVKCDAGGSRTKMSH